MQHNQMHIVQRSAMLGGAISDPVQTFRVCTTTCLNEPKHTKPQLGRSATLTIHYFQIKVQNKRLNTSVQNEDSPFEKHYFHRVCRISVSSVSCNILGSWQVTVLYVCTLPLLLGRNIYTQTISSTFFITL